MLNQFDRNEISSYLKFSSRGTLTLPKDQAKMVVMGLDTDGTYSHLPLEEYWKATVCIPCILWINQRGKKFIICNMNSDQVVEFYLKTGIRLDNPKK